MCEWVGRGLRYTSPSFLQRTMRAGVPSATRVSVASSSHNRQFTFSNEAAEVVATETRDGEAAGMVLDLGSEGWRSRRSVSVQLGRADVS